MQNRAIRIAEWLRARVTAAGARGLVVGLSGDLDSAVVARLCQLAAPRRTIGMVLAGHGEARAEEDAALVAAHFDIPIVRLDLGPVHDRLVDDLQALVGSIPRDTPADRPTPEEAVARQQRPLGNITPRLRMTSLYYVANSLDYLVAGTANRSDLTVGAFTKHGDDGVDLLPIGNLLKGDVRLMAVDLGVPRALLDRASSAGVPAPEQHAEFAYGDLERYLVGGPDSVAPALALRLERLIRASEHKRGTPPMPD